MEIDVKKMREECKKNTKNKWTNKWSGEYCNFNVSVPIEFAVDFKTLIQLKSMIFKRVPPITLKSESQKMMSEWMDKMEKELKEKGVKYEQQWKSSAVRS